MNNNEQIPDKNQNNLNSNNNELKEIKIENEEVKKSGIVQKKLKIAPMNP